MDLLLRRCGRDKTKKRGKARQHNGHSFTTIRTIGRPTFSRARRRCTAAPTELHISFSPLSRLNQ
jgi:hypothetical protein